MHNKWFRRVVRLLAKDFSLRKGQKHRFQDGVSWKDVQSVIWTHSGDRHHPSDRCWVQFHSNQGRSNDLDERVQGKFSKGSILGSKMDSFFGDGVGGPPFFVTSDISKRVWKQSILSIGYGLKSAVGMLVASRSFGLDLHTSACRHAYSTERDTKLLIAL